MERRGGSGVWRDSLMVTYVRGSYGGGVRGPLSVCLSVSVRSVPQYVDCNGEEGVIVGCVWSVSLMGTYVRGSVTP